MTCINCGREYKPLRLGYCSRCRAYLARYGKQRPAKCVDGIEMKLCQQCGSWYVGGGRSYCKPCAEERRKLSVLISDTIRRREYINKTPNYRGYMKRVYRGRVFNNLRRQKVGGYIEIYMPEHPFCNTLGWILEHRVIMENYLGFLILPCMDVHHKNGIRDDNRPQNLELLSRIEHARISSTGRKQTQETIKKRQNTMRLKKHPEDRPKGSPGYIKWELMQDEGDY